MHKTRAFVRLSAVGITKELKRYIGIDLQNIVPLSDAT
jgi:hypothetical protein